MEKADRIAIRHSARLLLLGAGCLLILAAVLISLNGYFQHGWSQFGFSSNEPSRNVIDVRSGGDLQAAIDRAQPGDTIKLEAGASFSGSFLLPNKPGNEFITIRSSAQDVQIPAPGVRIVPEKSSRFLPKIISNVKGSPAIRTAKGAHHFRFVAIEFGPTIEGLYDIVQIGTGAEKSVDELPHHIEFDRVFIHGDPVFGQRRGIAANGRYIKIENSYISDIKRKEEESQAIAVWATDGPVEIINNYLEAAAENILFGGAGSALKLVPSDCIVRNNFLTKRMDWQDGRWVVKNLFEIKNGRRIKIENNLMTHNWGIGQDGMAVLFTTRADNGPRTVIEDIDFVGNIVAGAGGGVNVYGAEGGGGHRLTITNNLFDDLDGQKWKGTGRFMKATEWDGLAIERNTILQKGNIADVYGGPVKNFIFRNNIVFQNEYGIKGDNMGSGQEVIDFYFSKGSVSNNVIIGGTKAQYREPNFFTSSLSQIGFADVSQYGKGLTLQSPFSHRGYEGTSIGAQLNPDKVGRSN